VPGIRKTAVNCKKKEKKGKENRTKLEEFDSVKLHLDKILFRTRRTVER